MREGEELGVGEGWGGGEALALTLLDTTYGSEEGWGSHVFFGRMKE